ncbi:dicarboxylate/amino acid:cation symporter [Nitrosomonas sp. ANs5]|uniref:dicarboxylate/amino acid:cation symporter n=1 Tax=Nitrosomonas sp. ANs5 TaxID=3423941 RepID=UPI003D34F072
MKFTTKLLIWMLAGFVLGSAINLFLGEAAVVQEYLVNGLFHAIGALFINLLKMLVVPLVTFSLISGVCAIGDIHKLGRIGFKAFLLFILTTALAITLAIGTALVFEPGKDFNLETHLPAEVEITVPHSLIETLIDIVPHNPVEAFATGNMLQIIFFSVLFATGLVMLGERGRLMVEIFDKLNEVMMQVVRLVMQTAPYGIFALMAKTFASHGPGLILPMISYFGVVIMVLMVHALGVLMLLLKLLGRVNPWVFLRKIRAAQIFAFGTASSNATIPVTLDVVERRIGVENSIASFVIPFGATINMDGTAIMQGVATIFIANVYGVEMGMSGYLTIILMTVVASIGTAGVPGVGLIMLAMVFNQVGLPIEGIALIMGVDRLLDMLRTGVNVTGDAVVATIVARSENGLSLPTFYDANSEAADALASSHKS